MTQASWWAKPGKDDVVAHTPDETKYHYPDQRQSERMRAGISGVVIPRANDDGTSKGFDGRVAGVVHVDPDAPDGGAVVNLNALDGNSLHGAFSGATYPHEVYYKLGVKPANYQGQMVKGAAPEPARVNPHVPSGAYIVPKASDDGTQLQMTQEVNTVQPVPAIPGQQNTAPAPPPQQPVAPVTPAAPVAAPAPMQPAPIQPAAAAPPPVVQPQVAAPPPQQQAYYPQPQAQDPAIAALTHQVGQLTQMVQGMMTQPPAPVQAAPAMASPLRTMPEGTQGTPLMAPPPAMPTQPPPATPRPVDDEEYQPRQSLRELETHVEEENQANRGVIVGFETLEMKFINGPIPMKAKREVYFEIPGAGTMAARFHAIIDSTSCLALVYDTRYEDGNQYLPPDLGDQQLKVSAPKMKKTWLCSSLGIHFNVGILDVVVLIKHDVPETDEYDDEDEEG